MTQKADTTETQLASFEREREGHIERVRILDTEIERLKEGRSASPKALDPAKVDVTVYTNWSEEDRAVFDHEFPQHAAIVKENWTKALAAAQR